MPFFLLTELCGWRQRWAWVAGCPCPEPPLCPQPPQCAPPLYSLQGPTVPQRSSSPSPHASDREETFGPSSPRWAANSNHSPDPGSTLESQLHPIHLGAVTLTANKRSKWSWVRGSSWITLGPVSPSLVKMRRVQK